MRSASTAEITQVAKWARQRGVSGGVQRVWSVSSVRGSAMIVKRGFTTCARRWSDMHGLDDVGLFGSFGVVTKKDGRSMPDEITLRALGLTAAEKLTEEQKDRLRR